MDYDFGACSLDEYGWDRDWLLFVVPFKAKGAEGQ
jgi:hypothetical protein